MTTIFRLFTFVLVAASLSACAASESRQGSPEGGTEPVAEGPSPLGAAADTSPSEGDSTSAPASGDIVIVDGIIRRVGSDPFSELVVTDADGQDWYLVDPGPAFADLEQRPVKVRGTLFLRTLTLADGRELGERRELLDAEVVE